MGISTSTFADVNSKETFDPILFPPENSLHAQVQHIEIDVAKNKVSMSLSAMQGALFSKIIESTASASPFSPTTPNSLNGSTTTTLIPTVFSVLEYPLSDFESALVCVASYLDTTDLCNFSRVCKLFRKLEVDYKVYLWKNLYRSHKLNMMILSTNPFHILERLQYVRTNCKTLLNGTTVPHVDDPLKDINVSDWKEACLKYVFIKRKLISDSHAHELLRNLSAQFQCQKIQERHRMSLTLSENKHMSAEIRRSRRQSRKILKTFRDSDNEDDFSGAWDSDEKTPSTNPNTPRLEGSAGLPLSKEVFMKSPHKLGKWGDSDNDESDTDQHDSVILAHSPITSSILHKVPSLVLSETFQTSSILALTSRNHSNSDNTDQSSRRDSLTNIAQNDSFSTLKLKSDTVQEETDDCWSSDSDSDKGGKIELRLADKPSKDKKDLSLSLSGVELDFSISEKDEPKNAMLKRYNDDDEESEDWGVDEEKNDEDSWGIDISLPPEFSTTPTNFNGGVKRDISAFCDDDEDSEDIGEESITPSSTRFNKLRASGNEDDDSDGDLIQQEVLEQETLTIDDLISNLTNEAKMRETYLSLSNAGTQKFHSQLYSLGLKTCMEDSMSQSPSAPADTLPEVLMEPNEWPTTREFYTQRKGQGVRVKFVFVESVRTPNPAKLCHPLIKQFGSTDDVMDHIYPGLIIGPWLLHWNPHHSLVIPRKMSSSLMHAQSRIHKIAEVFSMSLESVIDRIIPEIVRWNSSVVHDLKKSNGQHFIDRVMRLLELNDVLNLNKLGRAMYGYISTMRSEGRARIEFELDTTDSLYQPFVQEMSQGRKLSSRYFKFFFTHQELDEFSRRLIKTDSNFTIDRCRDYALLLVFDLIFWSKHMLHPMNAAYKPLKRNLLRGSASPSRESITSSSLRDLCCPFGATNPYEQ